jgi:hypothetical protein
MSFRRHCPVPGARWLLPFLLLCGGLPARAALLTVDDGAAVWGITPEVAVAVRLAPDPAETVAALQFEVQYDASRLRLARVESGQATLQAGKQVQSASLAPGSLRVLIYGFNHTRLESGPVALLVFQPATLAAEGLAYLDLTQARAAAASAAAVPISAGGGSIRIDIPGQAADLSRVKAYPNPFRPGQGHTGIIFQPLTSECTLRIYKLTGELVREFSGTRGGLALWDAGNAAGHPVASGVYLYTISNSQGERKNGKVVILR